MSTVFVWKEDYSPESSWRLVDWCMTRGADEFSLAVLGPPYLPESAWADVDEMLAPFRRRVASISDRWTLTGESAAVLREVLAGGLFGGEPGTSSLDDPIVYRGSVPFLSISTREGEGTLALRAEDEASLTRAGLPFHRERRRG